MRLFEIRPPLSVLTLIFFTSCGGQEGRIISGGFISNHVNGGSDETQQQTTLCSDFAKTKDSDNDGLKDYDEFFGSIPPDSTVTYRSDFEVADTDGDGRSDSQELNNKKVDGYTLQEPLTKNFALSPFQRDWLIFVFAKGGENSNQLISAEGWNSYSGIGSVANPLTQLRIQSGESIFIKAINDPALVDVSKIPQDWRPRISQGVYEDLTGCWRGTYGNNQGGCVSAAGDSATSQCANGTTCVGPQMNDTIVPANNDTKRNSLVGRFDTDGDRTTTESGLFAFPLGHLQSGWTADSTRIQGLGNLGAKHTQPSLNTFLLLRNQDGNGGDSLNDNSGFINVVVRFIDSDKESKFASAPTPAQISEFYNRLRQIYGQNICKDS